MNQDVIEPGQIYHLYNRGNNKEDIFIETKNYYYFLDLLKKHLINAADIYAYCLLKNHFHMLFRIKDKIDLPTKYLSKPYLPFSNLFNAYCKGINKCYNRTGSLFQKKPHRKRVSDEGYLTQLIAYIHLNPIKHGFTDTHKNYKFSSYNAYISNKETNIDKNFILNYFRLIRKFLQFS